MQNSFHHTQSKRSFKWPPRTGPLDAPACLSPTAFTFLLPVPESNHFAGLRIHTEAPDLVPAGYLSWKYLPAGSPSLLHHGLLCHCIKDLSSLSETAALTQGSLFPSQLYYSTAHSSPPKISPEAWSLVTVFTLCLWYLEQLLPWSGHFILNKCGFS